MGEHEASKSAEHRVEGSIFGPTVEEIPDRGPWAELGRDIPPGSSGAQDPEDRVDDLSTITRATAGLEVIGRKEVREQFPLLVGEAVARQARRRHACVRSRNRPTTKKSAIYGKRDSA
jgi:hypothetical protein